MASIMHCALIVALIAAAVQPAFADLVWGITYNPDSVGQQDLMGTFTTTCDSLASTTYTLSDFSACSFTETLSDSTDPFLGFLANEGGYYSLCGSPIPGCPGLEITGVAETCGADFSPEPVLGERRLYGHVVESQGKQEVGTCYYGEAGEETRVERTDGRTQLFEAKIVCEVSEGQCGGLYDRAG